MPNTRSSRNSRTAVADPVQSDELEAQSEQVTDESAQALIESELEPEELKLEEAQEEVLQVQEALTETVVAVLSSQADVVVDPIDGIHQCNHELVELLAQIWLDPNLRYKLSKSLKGLMGEEYPRWEADVNRLFAARRGFDKQLVDAAIKGNR